MNPFDFPFLQRGFAAVALLAPLLGALSHLVVARRLAFLSTALGQAALTGLTLGLALGEPISAPYGGMFGFCLLAALAMVWLKRRSALPADTLIGVFVAFTLGLSICLLVAVTQRFNVHQIEALMFGSLLTVTAGDLALLAALLVLAGLFLARRWNALLQDSVAPATTPMAAGERTRLDYLFVLLLTATIVASLKIVGALLVEAWVVIPAAAARQVARSLRQQVAWSIALALLGGFAGLLLSTWFTVPTGGAVVLALAVLFVVCTALGALRGGAQRRGR
ncbi:MAG: metal ABC transporter permease [Planctomycetes bacterium]|nr:metal ABC transporter permease [Planctomycetota bacterium]